MAFSFFRRIVSGAPKRIGVEDVSSEELRALSSELYVRELAFWQCVNLIAGALGKCEFKTFQGGKEVKGEEYYRWNFSPNKNQSSSVFLHKLVSKLFSENEALVAEADGQLLVADSFCHREYALLDDTFQQVTVGDFQFRRSFTQSEALYFKLHHQHLRPLLDGLYEAYQKLMEYGMRSYRKSRGMKGILGIDTIAQGDPAAQKAFDEIKNNGFKTFANAENAVMTLGRGLSYTDLGSKTYSNEGTRDIRAMIDDVLCFTARTLCIPPALLSGEVQGVADATEQLLTFCIDPLCGLIAGEINRKLYGKDVLRGDFLQIDTKCIKHVDLLSVSTAIDKLIASGAFSVNDIRKVVGEPVIDEAWAWRHWMTKNYSTVQDLLEAMECAKGRTKQETFGREST